MNKPWQPLRIPSAITPIGQLHQSPPSPIPGDLGRGPSHQSTCSNIKTPMDRPKSVVGVIRGGTERPTMSAVFLFDHQVLACTGSATSEYSSSTSSHCHCPSALLGRPGRVKFILDGLRWGKINQHTFRAKITSKVDRDSHTYVYIYIYIYIGVGPHS